LKCAVGPRRDDHRLVNAYKRFLEWDIVKQPRSVKLAERALSPLMGKSLIVYATKLPVELASASASTVTDRELVDA
jgi:hypothetical protein